MQVTAQQLINLKANLNEHRMNLRNNKFNLIDENKQSQNFPNTTEEISKTMTNNTQKDDVDIPDSKPSSMMNRGNPLLTDIRKKAIFERDPNDTTTA